MVQLSIEQRLSELSVDFDLLFQGVCEVFKLARFLLATCSDKIALISSRSSCLDVTDLIGFKHGFGHLLIAGFVFADNLDEALNLSLGDGLLNVEGELVAGFT